MEPWVTMETQVFTLALFKPINASFCLEKSDAGNWKKCFKLRVGPRRDFRFWFGFLVFFTEKTCSQCMHSLCCVDVNLNMGWRFHEQFCTLRIRDGPHLTVTINTHDNFTVLKRIHLFKVLCFQSHNNTKMPIVLPFPQCSQKETTHK